MVRAGGDECMLQLMDIVQAVWRTGKVPQEWRDCNLLPIPKKGNLALCDNWRGIALLDVVGKAVASLIQRRLQTLAENLLPDTQCGFCRGHSCTDMVFTVRQITEKLYEHRCKGFLVFVDLRKAYDSVNHSCLWLVLSRAGVPDHLITIIKSFHSHMTASLVLANIQVEPIEVNNGLRQGCCMAPTLFQHLHVGCLSTVVQGDRERP
eukprot:scpid60766/ scgid8074/ LINE-1 reverse transcriptase homolog